MYILVLPRFADLVPTSAIEDAIIDIDFAFFRIDSFQFFYSGHIFGTTGPIIKYNHSNRTGKYILSRLK